MSPVSAEVCQFRARSVGYRMGLTGNDGDGSGTVQANERPGERTEVRLYFQTGVMRVHAGPGPAPLPKTHQVGLGAGPRQALPY